MVHGASATLHVPAAQRLLVQLLAGAGHYRWSRYEHGRGALGHHRIVAGGQQGSTETRPNATTGTVDKASVMSWKPMLDGPRPPGRLARPVVSMVLTEPPPPEPSMMRTMGSRNCAAMRSAKIGFIGMVASAEPPRTVKSSPTTTTGRPSILARPITQFAGVSLLRHPAASYSALPAMAPISCKLPGSIKLSIRSRTVSRPPSC